MLWWEIFTGIDNSISFPSDSAYKDFKRKVKPSRKDDKNVDSFNFIPRSIIGERCESFGLSPFYKQTYDFLLTWRGNSTVTYEIALEISVEIAVEVWNEGFTYGPAIFICLVLMDET